MPNVTDNLLSISGNARVVADFVARAATPRGVLDFGAFVPALCDYEDVEPADDRSADADGLPAAQAAWGTDWNATHESLLRADGGRLVHYYFETSWNPPLIWLAAVAREYAELRFELIYIEPSEGFAGQQTYVQGTLEQELYSEDSLVLETYGGRRFDRLRAAIADPESVAVKFTAPALLPELPDGDIWTEQDMTDLFAAAKAARLATPSSEVEAKYLRLAVAYETAGDGHFAAYALRAAGHEERAVDRFVDWAGECEAKGMPSMASLILLIAGRETDGWALARRTVLQAMQPTFTP